MWERALVQELTNGRLHMQHGPIDVVLRAWGEGAEIERAYRCAAQRFETILSELVSELAELRRDATEAGPMRTPVARRMAAACAPFAGPFLTPMAAVAGAVADELLAVMCGVAWLDKAFVNDGGDIAMHIAPGSLLTIGVMGDFTEARMPGMTGAVVLGAEQPVRGIATSGAQGRSFSLGIADSVTVLAPSAALADAAATLIANAVDLDHPRIVRRPARELDPDSDLEDRPVTVLVPPLTRAQIEAALSAGAAVARRYQELGLICDAALTLQGETQALQTYLKLGTGH